MKNCKTFYEAQTANHLMEIVQRPSKPTPNQIKYYYVFGTKNFLRRYTEIYRHLLSKCFGNVVLERQEMVQCKCFFLILNRNMFVGKFIKSERFLTGFETFC